jgi:hypothetical protein
MQRIRLGCPGESLRRTTKTAFDVIDDVTHTSSIPLLTV